jgi:hypothetical protein
MVEAIAVNSTRDPVPQDGGSCLGPEQKLPQRVQREPAREPQQARARQQYHDVAKRIKLHG